MTYSREWEVITENEYQDTCRMKVPNGWLVRERFFCYKKVSVSIIFIRDGSNVWVLTDD